MRSELRRDDYQVMLEALSKLVLTYIHLRDASSVRRWTPTLAHIGNRLLADKGPRKAEA